MKTPALPRVGKVPQPKNTVPHLKLAHAFSQLATKHMGAALRGADPATARLPRPDMAAMDVQRGRPLVRQPVIGSPGMIGGAE